MPVITKRPSAENDLFDIWDYIADDSEARARASFRTISGTAIYGILSFTPQPTRPGLKNCGGSGPGSGKRGNETC